jgi:hypothetical protein
LRFGELAALTRGCVNLDAGTVTVVQSLVERDDGSLSIGLPKSEAGRRTFAVLHPRRIQPDALAEIDATIDNLGREGSTCRTARGLLINPLLDAKGPTVCVDENIGGRRTVLGKDDRGPAASNVHGRNAVD